LDLAARYHVAMSLRVPIFQSASQAVDVLSLIGDLADVVSVQVIFQQLISHSPLSTEAVMTEMDAVPASANRWFTFSPYPGEIVAPARTGYPLDALRNAGRSMSDFETGESISPRQRRLPSKVIAFITPTSALNKAMIHCRALVASDAQLDGTELHPRYLGSFPRVIRKWVIDTRSMDWVAAFNLLSLRPAKLISGVVPQFKNKGRIQVGADADIIVIDPIIIEDWATYQHPVQASRGVVHVVIQGRWVVKDGKLEKRVKPGAYIK
jgi:hypothetical protein